MTSTEPPAQPALRPKPDGERPSQGLAYSLAGFLGLAGLAHFVAPGFYRPLIPDALGSPDPWVYGSGLAEIAVGAAVAAPRTRRWGGYAAAALFVAVFPANVQMAIDATRDPDASTAYVAATYLRLPLQVPLVAWAWVVARRAPRA